MPELWRSVPTPRTSSAKVRAAAVATRQGGMISRSQLRECGYGDTTITRAITAGDLLTVHPGIFARGHRALGLPGRLWAALPSGGRGAALRHPTGAWHLGLIDAEPQTIHISPPGRRAPVKGIRIHVRRRLDVV